MVKAIETVYNGYKFRSRLEARWAVFFDALNTYYEYEPEGFDLNGRWYLPDFYIPKIDYWVEIKPYREDEKVLWQSINLCRRFADQAGKIILLFGIPGQHMPLFIDDINSTGIVVVNIDDPVKAEITQGFLLAMYLGAYPEDYELAINKARQARF